MDIKNYPLPLIDYVFVTLQEGEQFSKLDIADAYLQVKVKKSLLLIRHIENYSNSDNPFGLLSAVIIFHCVIKSVIMNI